MYDNIEFITRGKAQRLTVTDFQNLRVGVNVPDSVVIVWQKALDQMKADGVHEKILRESGIYYTE